MHRSPSRNLVICCDGTGNGTSENISNVLKLYRCLRKTEGRSCGRCCPTIPGVGTVTALVNRAPPALTVH
ncbi:phospholipase effector Tle1 domain-containing protein [Bradyrhizobium sp. DASA03007]|uniref:phospholipase effector Tle1 domain-containing protein n=1 Tax=unclassified Bradyrhizobium TaxID=2631580 RepID=UPI003F6FCDF1